jgi:hypothetical protein
MNLDPDIASSWNGRILVHIEASDSKFPEFGVDELPKEIL